MSNIMRSFINALQLYYKYRKAGIPFNTNIDEDYIDWYKNYRSSLIKFQNIHEGQDCFIIGNGPSLNQTNLNLLNDYYTFGLNKIHLIFNKYNFDLSYHVAVNSLVVEQMQDQFDNNIFKCPSFISYVSSKNRVYKTLNVYKLLSSGRWSFYHSILEPIHEGYTVTYVAMQIAYFMGFKNIFLVGIDHNFQQIGKPNEQQKYTGADVNHFHPDYFKGMQWHLADIEGNEASYAMARHEFHEKEGNIYDATINGKLNLFPKIQFDEALALAKKKRVI